MLAERLRDARQAAGLSQAELAEQAGLSTIYVSLIEQGVRHNPRLNHLRALARVLGCQISDLVDDPPPK